MRVHFLAALGAAALFSLSARAEVVRFPETGSPAFVITTPDGWTHQPDGNGNMLLIASNKQVGYSLTMSHFDGSLDNLAAEVMKALDGPPPQQMGPTSISGYRGYMYDSSVVFPSGAHRNLHMVIVKTDSTHFASLTLITPDSISGADYQAAQGVSANTSITGP